MMAPDRANSNKRKRSSIPDSQPSTSRPTPRKRPKKLQHPTDKDAAGPQQLSQLPNDPEPFYAAKAIVKEDKNRYLIDWADNPETGEKYARSWEPKRNANKQLVDEWKQKKLAKKSSKQKAREPAPAPRPAAATHSPATSQPPPKRRFRVDSSSPELESERQPNVLPISNSSAFSYADNAVPETESRDTRPRTEAEVIVTQPTDYNPSDYEHFSASQIPWSSSQATTTLPSQFQPTQFAAGSSQAPGSLQSGPKSNYIPAETLLRQPCFGDGAVVPDSQSLPGDSSYVPSTETHSGAGSQLAQGQPQPCDSAATRTQQRSSISASAQLTNSQPGNSSAPVPETDPIEEFPSSPAENSHQDEHIPLQRESPWQSASSASSPPPTESLDKSTQSQPQSGDTHLSQEVQVGTPLAASKEQRPCCRVEPDPLPPSLKTSPLGQDKATPEGSQGSEEFAGEQVDNVTGPEGERTGQIFSAAEEIVRTQEQDESVRPTTESEHGYIIQRDLSQETAVDSNVNTGDTQDIEANVPVSQVEERTDRQRIQSVSGRDDSGSGEVQRLVTCPEYPGNHSIEPEDLNKGAESQQQHPAEVLTKDTTDPEHPSCLQYAQKDLVLEPHFNCTATQTPPEHTLSQLESQFRQSAQDVPELELGTAQSRDQTDFTDPGSSEPIGESSQPQSTKRKDSSQDSVEPSVFRQADTNVVCHPALHSESNVPGPKDIVPSIEARTESPLRGYYRKSSRGMPQTPQPTGSIGGIDTTNPKSLTEQIREVHARSRAERERRKAELLARYDNPAPKSPSLETGTRSPSAIPSNGTQPPMEPQYTLMPSNLSAETRPDGDLPDAHNEHSLPEIRHPGSDIEMHEDGSPSVLLEEPLVGEAEYLIGLSMEGLQGDQYRREINFKKDEITDFTENDHPQESSIAGVHELLEKVGNVITHMDLGYANEDSLTQYDNSSKVLVAWSNNSSTKFRFLGGVLDRLRHSKMHFVIMGRAGSLIDIIETFVGGLDIQYSRGGNIDRQAFGARESLFVTILATDFEDVDTRIPNAHLIFAMDSTVRCNEPKMRALRNHLRGDKDTIPVITPIATNSLEHVERCISPSLQGFARERLVVRFMTELRQLAGRVDVSTKADHAANLIVPSIEADLDHHEAWPLPRVGSIKHDVHFDESMISSLSVSSSVPTDTMNPSAGQKRHLEIEEEDEPAKRTRLTPQPESHTVNPNDITRISDSMPGVSQAHGMSSSSKQGEHVRAYEKDQKLRKELKYTKERLKHFEEALDACQTEKEEQKDLIFHLKRENTDLKQSQINYSERIRTQNGLIDSLRTERNSLKEQLDAARKQLETSAIPEVAEREQLRRERDEALARLERAQKSRETENRESEFFRSQYQDASNRASELSGEVATLTQQVRELERLAGGERERARQLSLAAATDAYRDEVEMLRQQLRDREEIIKQRTDEIKAIRGRQGVGTRAGSVPRSPRISGPGSRGGSPAPSGLSGHGRLGALRNINA